MKNKIIKGALGVSIFAIILQPLMMLFASAESYPQRLDEQSNGNATDYDAGIIRLSSDGRYAVYDSTSNNIVGDDNNGVKDIFFNDRQSGITTLISRSQQGSPANGRSYGPAITPDGRFIVYSSIASDIVMGDTNGWYDIFLFDRQTGETEIVSKGLNGTQANLDSRGPTISADGRYIAFYSFASNLVGNDANGGLMDVFVYDAQNDDISLVSRSADDVQGNGHSNVPSISADGRYVAFASSASNLIDDDNNGWDDIYVKDIYTGAIAIASVSSSGQRSNGGSNDPMISADGRFVTYFAAATNLVENDVSTNYDIFIHNLETGVTDSPSVSMNLTAGNNSSFSPSISADGRYVAFSSGSSDLVIGDTNNHGDIFVRDRLTNSTRIFSISAEGTQANAGSQSPSISADGQYVAFLSMATNITTGDTNGSWDYFVASNPPAINATPLSNPGADQTVNVGSAVNLDAGLSVDPDGNSPLTYAWTLDSKPLGSMAQVATPSAVDPSFFADKKGQYVLSLIVTDNKGLSSSASQITITAVDTLSLSPAKLWVGLQTNKDKNVKFDIRAELYINGALVSEGESVCIAGIAWKENAAKEVSVAFDRNAGILFNSGDYLSMKVYTRMGTNTSGNSCNASKDIDADGLRLFYAGLTRPSGLGVGVNTTPSVNRFIDVVSGSSVLSETTPIGIVKYVDSTKVEYAGNNQWKSIGEWSMNI